MFDEKKSTALASLLLENKEGKKFKYLGLIKLMYLCDREMISEYNRPITKDTYVSMKLGPVLSNTLSLIRNDSGQFDDELKKLKNNPTYYKYFWSERISTNGYFVHLEKKGNASKILDEEEKKTIEKVISEYNDKDPFELVELLHNQEKFPEWEDPAPYGVKPISLITLLKSLGKQYDDISQYIYRYGH